MKIYELKTMPVSNSTKIMKSLKQLNESGFNIFTILNVSFSKSLNLSIKVIMILMIIDGLDIKRVN